ncbi:MAG: hypothetical protein ABUT39_18505 [Acidobacteriota bacterium]
MDIGIIISGLGLAKSVAELAGLIETLDGKIDKLSQSELAAGLRNLDQACSSKVEAGSLLREARSCFNKAVGLESGYRRGIAYMGLALSHSYLHDRENCTAALRELLSQTPIPSINAEFVAKVRAENKDANLFKKFIVETSVVTQLSRFAAVLARRANFTPDSIRQFVQPTRDEMILGVKMDADARNLAKLQILVASHLGEGVKWMERYKLSAADVSL